MVEEEGTQLGIMVKLEVQEVEVLDIMLEQEEGQRQDKVMLEGQVTVQLIILQVEEEEQGEMDWLETHLTVGQEETVLILIQIYLLPLVLVKMLAESIG